MQLTHSFVIPAGIEETWAHFQDIATVAECFPGAKVTSAEGDDFQGTAKVKLGPVALQYSGAGSFIERDEAAHLMVFEAKGKDKRGNGTAGATVRLTFAEASDGTRADVVTDLSVTGRPAQFGSRMMQEVSDKLLGQFVECLQQQVGSGGSSESGGDSEAAAAAAATGVDADEVAGEADWVEGAAARQAALAGGQPMPTSSPSTSAGSTGGRSAPGGRSASGHSSTGGSSAGGQSSTVTAPSTSDKEDALDLGATVLPVLARMYGKHAGAGLVLLVVLWLLRRRAR